MVNAANEGCISGGGVDGEVSYRGGDALAQARHALPIVEGTRGVRCPTGEARITIGGTLKTPYCIHAVGPNYNMMMGGGRSMKDCDDLLVSAYCDSMSRGREKALKSIGFSLLSAGIFRGPQSLQEVLAAGVRGILQGLYPELEEVHMVAFTQKEQMELQEVCSVMSRGGLFSENSMSTASSPTSPAPDSPTQGVDVEAAAPEEVFTNEAPPREAVPGPSLPSGAAATAQPPNAPMDEAIARPP